MNHDPNYKATLVLLDDFEAHGLVSFNKENFDKEYFKNFLEFQKAFVHSFGDLVGKLDPFDNVYENSIIFAIYSESCFIVSHLDMMKTFLKIIINPQKIKGGFNDETALGILTKKMRQYGYGILCLGVIGFVFAFGESTGLPFTDKRMLLPFGVLREMIDSLRAFRGAWRFSLLDVLAVAWWAGVGFSALKNRYGNKSFIIPSAMVCLSIPVALPIAEIPSEINIPSSSIDQPKLLLTLPAPDHEFNEDQTEALWLLRAIRTNSQVTGGATGWVPESVAKLRVDLAQCEAGLKNPSCVFDKFTIYSM